MNIPRICLHLFFCLFGELVSAQVSPPGLDGTRLVSWGAVGFSQTLNQRLTLSMYAGGARMSDPDNWSLLHKSGIAVYNHELQYKFSPTWQVSLANSLRLQSLYTDDSPFEKEDPSYRFELRHYARLYYKQQYGKLAMNYSFRPEFRTFYSPQWHLASRPVELRFRLKGQASLPLNEHKTNLIIGANELLSAIDEYNAVLPSEPRHSWSSYHFTEDRLSLYFRHVFKEPDLILDLGLMEQFKSGDMTNPVSYLSVDVIFQNPFSRN